MGHSGSHVRGGARAAAGARCSRHARLDDLLLVEVRVERLLVRVDHQALAQLVLGQDHEAHVLLGQRQRLRALCPRGQGQAALG